MSEKWFLTMTFVFVALLLLQGMLELILNTRKSRNLFRIQLIDYMENTMRARLENEYFHKEEKEEYQREYFEVVEEENDKETVKSEGKSNQQEMLKELMNSLLEEMELDRDIARRQRQLFKGDDSERAQLFDEILKEYI